MVVHDCQCFSDISCEEAHLYQGWKKLEAVGKVCVKQSSLGENLRENVSSNSGGEQGVPEHWLRRGGRTSLSAFLKISHL